VKKFSDFLSLKFSGRRIEWRYFRLHQIQFGGRPPSWIISNGHISATAHSIHLYSAHCAVIFAIAQLSCIYSYRPAVFGISYTAYKRKNRCVLVEKKLIDTSSRVQTRQTVTKINKSTDNSGFNLLFTSFSVSDPNSARFESFQSYFFGFTSPVSTEITRSFFDNAFTKLH